MVSCWDFKSVDYIITSRERRISLNKDLKIKKKEMINKAKNGDNLYCEICGKEIFGSQYSWLEIDHIIPISCGGNSEKENLQAICKRCHHKKTIYDKLIVNFFKKICLMNGNSQTGYSLYVKKDRLKELYLIIDTILKERIYDRY